MRVIIDWAAKVATLEQNLSGALFLYLVQPSSYRAPTGERQEGFDQVENPIDAGTENGLGELLRGHPAGVGGWRGADGLGLLGRRLRPWLSLGQGGGLGRRRSIRSPRRSHPITRVVIGHPLPGPPGRFVGNVENAVCRSRSRRLDQRQDYGADRLGQIGPSLDEFGQVRGRPTVVGWQLSTAPSNRGASGTPIKWLRSSANSGPKLLGAVLSGKSAGGNSQVFGRMKIAILMRRS